MCLAVEFNVGRLDFPFALDVNPVWPVDQNIRHRGVCQQGLYGAQSEHFVLDALNDLTTLHLIDGQTTVIEQVLRERLELLTQGFR